MKAVRGRINALALVHPCQSIVHDISPGGMGIRPVRNFSIQLGDRLRIRPKGNGLLRHPRIIPRGPFLFFRQAGHGFPQSSGKVGTLWGVGNIGRIKLADRTKHQDQQGGKGCAHFVFASTGGPSLETRRVLFFSSGTGKGSPAVVVPKASLRRVGNDGISKAKLNANSKIPGARNH